MKKIVLIISGILSFVSLAHAGELKIAFVDVAYVMGNSPQASAINEKLKQEFKEPEEELKALAEKYKKLQEKAQKDGATMSEKEQLELMREGQEMESKLKLKQKNLNEDFQRRLQEERRILGAAVMQVIQQYSNDEKYDMVVTKEALLWATDAMNISAEVLAKMNSTSGK